MKIGIYNIYVVFVYSLLLFLTSIFGYVIYRDELYKSLSLVLIIPVIMTLFGLFLWGYLFYKFQIVIINKTHILDINPFLFKFKKIDFKHIKAFNYYSWISGKGFYFVGMEITDFNKKKIIFSQAVFENFESMVNSLHLNSGKKIPFKMKDLLLKEAKESMSGVKFNLFLLIPILIFIIGTTLLDKIPFSSFHLIVIIINVILLFATFRRLKSYKLRLKQLK